MDAVRAKFLNVYDVATSFWLTLDQEQRLALFLMVSGALLFMLAVERMRADRTARRRSANIPSTGAIDSSEFEVDSSQQETPLQGATAETSWLGGLQRTRHALSGRLQQILGRSDSTRDELFEQLEELLITSDMGVKTTHLLLDRLRQRKDASPAELKAELRDSILEILRSEMAPEIVPARVNGDPLVIAVIGVNGVGKTTTIGKLAWQFSAQGKKVLIAAGDTFRAAAEQQLQIWAERAGADILVGAQQAKPATVAYEAIHKAKKEGFDVLIVDTAGRLHTRVNLMNELQNVLMILGRELPGSPHETILVVDASTGQNALQQAIDFNKCAPLSGIIVTKLDGTPKGGIIVAISHELKVPIRYVGIGEQATDLKLFSAEEFTAALFAEDATAASDENVVISQIESEKEPIRAIRRQRPQ